MGDGSQFCNKATIDKFSGQLITGVGQPKENIGQLKTLETKVATSMRNLYNSAHSESKSQDKPQHTNKDLLKSNMVSELSRRHLFDDYVHELPSQAMKAGSLDLDQRLINISGIGQFGDFSGHNQSLTFKDGSSQSWLYQAMLDPHLPTVGHRSFNEIGRSQLRDVGGHSFIRSHSQPPMVKESTGGQNPASHVQPQFVGEGEHVQEISNFMTHMARSQATSTIPHLNPIYKDHIVAPNQEMRIHPDHRAQSSRSFQPSQRMTDPEESFYPMQMEELSHSFSSHHGFFPLEPLQDRTMSGTVSTTLPHTSPEHPFQEEPPSNVAELPPNRKPDEERATPNPLLQYYIRMLLERTPGDPLNDLEEASRMNPDVTELRQYLQKKGNQPAQRSEEKEPSVPKPQTNVRKQAESKASGAVKKEILPNPRRQNVTKPLKRLAAPGGRGGIWK
ncbi:PREDICTED: uncharacterized protein LOC108793772 [Nanorana parkeri]|uniref:uncharacterized protein LOC108793772 n=1 Tax=Nanorana parkeri TaxID=125878 RepID=UPI00085443C5|nr:PREDICTED: uncharacterized protein LOC108793772 [Nanorana parkeri]